MASGRKTGGRRKGTPNRRTADLEARIAEAAAVIEGALPDAFKGDAHAYLMTVYKNPALPVKDRLAAATAAIGYEKPKLGSVDVKAEVDATVAVSRIELVAPLSESDDRAAH